MEASGVRSEFPLEFVHVDKFFIGDLQFLLASFDFRGQVLIFFHKIIMGDRLAHCGQQFRRLPGFADKAVDLPQIDRFVHG